MQPAMTWHPAHWWPPGFDKPKRGKYRRVRPHPRHPFKSPGKRRMIMQWGTKR